MLRQTLLFAVCSMMAASAMATTVIFRGTLTREQCVDDGNVFSQGTCRKVAAGADRECLIAVNYTGERQLSAVQVKANAILNSGDRRSNTLSASLKSPYYVDSKGFAYSAKFDRDASIELFADFKTMAITKANLYMSHDIQKNGNKTVRTYIQYACRGLKAVRQ